MLRNWSSTTLCTFNCLKQIRKTYLLFPSSKHFKHFSKFYICYCTNNKFFFNTTNSIFTIQRPHFETTCCQKRDSPTTIRILIIFIMKSKRTQFIMNRHMNMSLSRCIFHMNNIPTMRLNDTFCNITLIYWARSINIWHCPRNDRLIRISSFKGYKHLCPFMQRKMYPLLLSSTRLCHS